MAESSVLSRRFIVAGIASTAVLFANLVTSLAAAQQAGPAGTRLPIVPAGPAPREGLYATADDIEFMVEHRDGQPRLRFVEAEEIFYLTSEPAMAGGRVLKFDTGETALAVSPWGGVTLYSRRTPIGVPAERGGDANGFEPRPVAAKDIKLFAARLSQQLADKQNLAIGFASDWAVLEHDAQLRALAADSMRNATYALELLATSREMRAVLADRLHAVRVAAAAEKSATLQNEVLVVTFEPQNGPASRPSSLAIARAVEARLSASAGNRGAVIP